MLSRRWGVWCRRRIPNGVIHHGKNGAHKRSLFLVGANYWSELINVSRCNAVRWQMISKENAMDLHSTYLHETLRPMRVKDKRKRHLLLLLLSCALVGWKISRSVSWRIQGFARWKFKRNLSASEILGLPAFQRSDHMGVSQHMHDWFLEPLALRSQNPDRHSLISSDKDYKQTFIKSATY